MTFLHGGIDISLHFHRLAEVKFYFEIKCYVNLIIRLGR